MKIKNIQLHNFRTYKDWQFTPKETGVHLIYGPNESGKTTLLEGLRGLIFNWLAKDRKTSSGSLTVVQNQEEYRISRNGKQLDFYKLGEESLNVEPANLWWHDLDRKTYERIFAITLEDMHGLDIMNEVDVRTRFFGAEGGANLSQTVKDIKKASAELLVASANGKRKINTLLKELKDVKKNIQTLAAQEEEYVKLRTKIEATQDTELELNKAFNQWQDYKKGIELVLRAWDTFKRAEEAQIKMNELVQGSLPEQERFLTLDQEINKCHEYMRIWRGREDALLPENFSPNDPVGVFSNDINNLYEQLSKWEQLIKDCEQGSRFIDQLQEQLQITRQMHHLWKENTDFSQKINWLEAEELANKVKNIEYSLSQWQHREPISLNYKSEMAEAEIENLSAIENEIKTSEVNLKELREKLTTALTNNLAIDEFKKQAPSSVIYYVMAVLAIISSCGSWIYSRTHWHVGFMVFSAVAVIFASIMLILNAKKQSKFKAALSEITTVFNDSQDDLESFAKAHNYDVPKSFEDLAKEDDLLKEKRDEFYNRDREKMEHINYLKEYKRWQDDGKELENKLKLAQENWVNWLPAGANKTCSVDSLYSLKEEFDNYNKHFNQYSSYQKRLQEHQEELKSIVNSAKLLWGKLEQETEPTPVGLRLLHRKLQNYEQNKVRYEQKESQRKSYRTEYDKWHCKEKELLIEQEAIIKKSGFDTAVQFRQKLLSMEQYRQWETIYKQSKVQLKLLAPDQDNYDLLLRRLNEGDLEKWLEEDAHAHEQMVRLENQLANLYEHRGKLSESLRQLGDDETLSKALQKQSQYEEELQSYAQDWLTKVYMEYFIERAQQKYEEEKQPQVLDIASNFVEILTNNRYTLDDDGIEGELVLHDKNGQILTADSWSSGLSDQVYLALRLSLAKRFGAQVDPMPIILDDIFVRFDETRQKAALKVLADLSKTEQIFVFTCQEQLMRLAKELADERLNLIEFKDNRQLEEYV